MDSDVKAREGAGSAVPRQGWLQTIGYGGKGVVKRFTDPGSAWQLFNRIKEDSAEESSRRARIRRVYDQFSPYNPEQLKARGLANQSNVRFGMLPGIINARAAAVVEWAVDTTPIVELQAMAAESAGPDAQDIADVIADEFSYAVRQSPTFIHALSSCVRDSDLYGYGAVGWQDRWDYQPVALESGQVKVPDSAPAQSARNELIFVESEFDNAYLVSLLDDKDAAAKLGWNVAGVEEFVRKVFSEGASVDASAGDDAGTSVQEAQNKLERENRRYEVKQFDRLKVIHIYTRDVSGKRGVTHQIIPASGDPRVFLFEAVGVYSSMDSCVIWLAANPFERNLRGLRGIASALLPVSDLNDRLMCQLYDWLFREASIKVRSSLPGDRPRLTILEQGPYTVFGAEAEAAPVQSAAGNVQQIIQTLQATQGFSFAAATGAAGPGAAPQMVWSGNSRRTQAEVEGDGAAGKRYERMQLVSRVVTFDSVFRESFRRFMGLVNGDRYLRDRYPGVAEFIDRCGRRGVGKEQLARAGDLFRVSLSRDLVLGGSGAKASSLTEFVKDFGGSLDERGLRSATRDVAQARFGRRSADRYRGEGDRDQLPSDSASFATVENNALVSGQQALVGGDQLHWSHIPVHMGALAQIIRAAEAGEVEDAQRALDQLGALSTHVQEHLRYAARLIGKKEQADTVMQQIRSIRPVVQSLTMQAAAQRRHADAVARQQEQELQEMQEAAQGHKEQAQMHESDNKARVKMREQDLLQEARLEGVRGKLQIEALKARQQGEIDRIKENAKAYRDSLPTFGARRPLAAAPATQQIPEPGLDAGAGF